MEIAALTRGQRRYLKRYACILCGQPLDQDGCAAIWTRCSSETRDKRRADCLAQYRPRGGESPCRAADTATDRID
jgi:hypothetical protein